MTSDASGTSRDVDMADLAEKAGAPGYAVEGGATPAGGASEGVGSEKSGGASAGDRRQDGNANVGDGKIVKGVDGDAAEDGRSHTSGARGTGASWVCSVVRWTEGRHPLVSEGPVPVSRIDTSSPSLGTRLNIPQVADDVLLDAAVTNRWVALTCIDQGRWGNLPGLVYVLETAYKDPVDERLSEAHGDAKFGNQGKPHQAYEVLAFANEIIRFGVPLHIFHPHLDG